ncbi:MAG: heavy metal-binding domain-containing protein [Labilithrix sp.]
MSQGQAGGRHGGGNPNIPQHAHSRIAEMKAKHLFTCDLSINEFLLVKEAGFDPLGLVMGTSIYHVVPTVPQIPQNQPGCEHWDMTKALYHARELAMSRMEQEADELGADGIIGVRLVVNLDGDPQRIAFRRYRQWQDWAHEQGYPRRVTNLGSAWFQTWEAISYQQWNMFCQQMGWPPQPAPWFLPQKQATYALGQNVVEFMAIGTAVKHRGPENFKNKKGKPFQSALSGQEFWMLVKAGYRPVGFVMGNCVYYIPPWLLRAPDTVSGELSPYTHALYDARELAIERLQWEAESLGATGIVDVTVSEHSHAWMRSYFDPGNAALRTGEMLELFVIGTAVIPMPGAEVSPEGAGKTRLVHVVMDRRADQKIGVREE